MKAASRSPLTERRRPHPQCARRRGSPPRGRRTQPPGRPAPAEDATRSPPGRSHPRRRRTRRAGHRCRQGPGLGGVEHGRLTEHGGGLIDGTNSPQLRSPDEVAVTVTSPAVPVAPTSFATEEPSSPQAAASTARVAIAMISRLDMRLAPTVSQAPQVIPRPTWHAPIAGVPVSTHLRIIESTVRLPARRSLCRVPAQGRQALRSIGLPHLGPPPNPHSEGSAAPCAAPGSGAMMGARQAEMAARRRPPVGGLRRAASLCAGGDRDEPVCTCPVGGIVGTLEQAAADSALCHRSADRVGRLRDRRGPVGVGAASVRCSPRGRPHVGRRPRRGSRGLQHRLRHRRPADAGREQ